MKTVYNQIGNGYSRHRNADRRIVDQLVRLQALSPPATIADIGAGTGNYSRALADLGFQVEAVEPSDTMRRQANPHAAVRWHAGSAEAIPLPEDSVDAVTCILAAHHFSSVPAAVAEMERVCSGGAMVWLTFDPRLVSPPWIADYFPEIWEAAFAGFPPLDSVCELMRHVSGRSVESLPFLVPWDLEDCFVAAGWRRPEMYLDSEVRTCMSAFALADAGVVERGLQRLESDLRIGRWADTHRELLAQDVIDWGYRFVRCV
jgi:ubiquinone/menaquinone biosynthesis C-methylase UbiE